MLQGQRRIRVHTVAMPVTDSISAMFKQADLDAQITVMARRLAASLPGGTLASARDGTTATTVTTLAAYRKHCASTSSAVQLILPEALKLLPLYALSLLKGPALRVRRREGEAEGGTDSLPLSDSPPPHCRRESSRTTARSG